MVGDPERLRQALLNLLMNSRDAMPDGGLIRIALDPWGDENGRVSGFSIEVQDTGLGFPDELLDRVFDPFVSGKRLGTGLGLANVRRTVEAHGGEITASNRPGGGACVSLRLPRGLDDPGEKDIAISKPAKERTRNE